jgi:hypothetical protein
VAIVIHARGRTERVVGKAEGESGRENEREGGSERENEAEREREEEREHFKHIAPTKP